MSAIEDGSRALGTLRTFSNLTTVERSIALESFRQFLKVGLQLL